MGSKKNATSGFNGRQVGGGYANLFQPAHSQAKLGDQCEVKSMLTCQTAILQLLIDVPLLSPPTFDIPSINLRSRSSFSVNCSTPAPTPPLPPQPPQPPSPIPHQSRKALNPPYIAFLNHLHPTLKPLGH